MSVKSDNVVDDWEAIDDTEVSFSFYYTIYAFDTYYV